MEKIRGWQVDLDLCREESQELGYLAIGHDSSKFRRDAIAQMKGGLEDISYYKREILKLDELMHDCNKLLYFRKRYET